MASHTRVLNITTGQRLKRNQALGRIEQCVSEWVEEGFSIRNLSLAETVARRSKQARDREPLPEFERPGIVFKPPIGAQAAYAMERKLAFEANRFASQNLQ